MFKQIHEMQNYYFSSKYFTWGIFIADSYAFTSVVKEYRKHGPDGFYFSKTYLKGSSFN